MNFFCSCNSKDKIQLEKEKTEEVAISIINMIENNNREELKNRFTDKAIQTQDFDLGLEYIFNCYSGKCENISLGRVETENRGDVLWLHLIRNSVRYI